MAQTKTFIDPSLPGRQYTTGQYSGMSRSYSYNSNGGGMARATGAQSNGSNTKPKSTPVSYNEGKEYVRNPTRVTASSNGNVPPTTKYIYVNNGGDGGGYEGGGGYSGGGHAEDIISKIKALLEQQKTASDEYAKTLYEQTLAQNKQAYQGNQRQANLNYMRGDRYLKSLYGDAISGQGLSNRARNNSNWQNNLSSIRQNWTNNDASAKASYNANLANNASTLAQGWYNYVLPVYTNRQTQLDNLEYRKYLASL